MSKDLQGFLSFRVKFIDWLRDYTCSVKAPFLSVGCYRLGEDYLRANGIDIMSFSLDERGRILELICRKFVLPLARVKALDVVYLGNGVIIVNVSKVAMGCEP